MTEAHLLEHGCGCGCGQSSETVHRHIVAVGAFTAGADGRGGHGFVGPEWAAALTHVSADGAEWIHTALHEKAPRAVLRLDLFPVVMEAMKALDKVRVRTIAAAGGSRDRNPMWAVRQNPGDLNSGQRTTLADLEDANGELYRAYLLKEQLREVFRTKGRRGHQLLAGWIAWAKDSCIGKFEKLCQTIQKHHILIRNTLDHAVTNARFLRSPAGIDPLQHREIPIGRFSFSPSRSSTRFTQRCPGSTQSRYFRPKYSVLVQNS